MRLKPPSPSALSQSRPTTDSPPSPVDRRYYPYFDWLRFVLACTVMLYHFGFLNFWHQSGNFAVQVFFALSGWLIGGILLDTTRAELPRFYFNRVIRIWAPYYLALVFLVVASLLREPVTAKWLEFVAYKATFVWNLFGTQQLAQFRDAMPLKATGNHFWSVNAEEQFYLLAPWLLVLAVPRIGRHPVTWIVVATAACVFDVYGAIALGVLAAVWHRRFPNFHAGPIAKLACLAVIATCAAGFADSASYVRLAPVAAVAIVLLLAIEGRRTPAGALVGGLSYPLYLNHWIGGFVATVLLMPIGLGHTRNVQLPLGIVLNLGLAAALYWFIDRRLLARRAQWATLGRDRLAMGASYALVVTGLAVGIVLTRFTPH